MPVAISVALTVALGTKPLDGSVTVHKIHLPLRDQEHELGPFATLPSLRGKPFVELRASITLVSAADPGHVNK